MVALHCFSISFEFSFLVFSGEEGFDSPARLAGRLRLEGAPHLGGLKSLLFNAFRDEALYYAFMPPNYKNNNSDFSVSLPAQ